MNRIDSLFKTKKRNILSVYFTAGFPEKDSIERIILSLDKNGADMIEIGIPYSDPLADGPVIQETSRIAIENGMTLERLFVLLRDIRKKSAVPLLLMGYLNPVLKYGFPRFCRDASSVGIDGLILPDLPVNEYVKYYKNDVLKNNLKNIFLITPDTPEQRIRMIDDVSTGFVYMVSASATTGGKSAFSEEQLGYFKKVSSLNLKNPVLAGFGVHDRKTREQVSAYVNGAITGSAYLRALQGEKSIEEASEDFLKSI